MENIRTRIDYPRATGTLPEDAIMAFRFLSMLAAFAFVSLAACAAPVAVVGTNGFVLKGTVTGNGNFTVSNATLSCTGTAPLITTVNERTIPVACTDGRKGAVIAHVQGGAMSGRLRLNDGTAADFIVGDAAKNF
jgi:hypothetical protein